MSDGIGRELALRSAGRGNCGVCRLGYNIMAMVNRQIINGAPYTDIHKLLWEMRDQGTILSAPSYQSIRNHSKNHLKFTDAVVRANIERRAVQRNIDIENGVQNILTDIGVAEAMMQIGYGKLVEGKMEITSKDLLAAAKMVRDFTNDDEGSLDMAQMQVQVGFILQAVKEITSEDQWEKISKRVIQLRDSVEDAVIEPEVDE